MSSQVLVVAFASVYGGGELYLRRLLAVLSSRGGRVDALVATLALAEGLRGDGHAVTRYRADGVHYLTACARLLARLVRRRYDRVILNGHVSLRFAWVAVLVPTVHIAHMDLRGELASGSRIRRLLVLAACSLPQRTVSISPRAHAFLVRRRLLRAKTSYVHIPNWPDDRFLRWARNTASRPASGSTRVLFVGELVPRKGLGDLLDACSGLREVELVVAGTGPERLRYQARSAGAAVRFLGFVDDPLPLYLDADVFVLPSYSEGLPTVLLEAMLMGVPCVCSDLPTYVGLVSPGVNALTFAAGDVATLRSLLVRLARDPVLRRNIGRGGHISATQYLRAHDSPRKTADFILA
jgi:glycosyltransferase involved in cell wall biosynthesis